MKGLAWQKIQPRLLDGTIWEDPKFEKETVKVGGCLFCACVLTPV